MRRHLLALGCVLFITTLAAAQEKAKLPVGAALRIGVHRLRVAGPIADYAFTPDQRTLIVAYDEPNLRKPNLVLFDVATGLERQRLPITGAKYLAMAKHKPLLAVDTFNGIEVWDVATLKRVRQWDFPECIDEASALAISPDGTQVVAATPTLLRWDVETGKTLAPFRLPPSAYRIEKLQFSADGSKLLTTESYVREYRNRRAYFGPGGADALSPIFESVNFNLLYLSGLTGPKTRLMHHTLWSAGSLMIRPATPMAAVLDTRTGTKLLEIGNETGDYAFSPDGTMIAMRGPIATASRIDIFRLERGWPFVGSINRSGPMVFSPDGKQVLVEGDALWDIAARKVVREFVAPNTTSMRFSPDGKLLALVKFDADSNLPGSLRYGKNYGSTINPSSFSGRSDNQLQLMEVATGKPRTFADGYSDEVGGLAYSPDGRWLASFSRETIFIHDAKTGAELRRWSAHKAPIEQIAFSPDGKTLASASQDTKIGLWDPTTGKERKRLAYGNQNEKLVAFNPDGKTLISVTDNGVVRRWDLVAGKHADSTQPLAMMSHSLSPNGEYVAYLESNRETGAVRLQWLRTRTGKSLTSADANLGFGQQSGNDSFAFSMDGKLLAGSGYLAVGDDKTAHAVRIWESITQREIVRFASDQPPTRLLAISPDGRLLAHGMSPAPNPQPGANEVILQVPERTGEFVASVRAIVLRDLASAQGSGKNDDKTLRPINGHLGPITCLAFSPDGKFLATGGADQVVYIWRVEHFLKRTALPNMKANVADYWPDLADSDAGNAYRAIAQLERKPKETIALLRKHLQPASVTEAKVIDKHVRDLASGNFAIRSQANAALEKLGAEAASQLRTAVKNPPNLEVKRRLETLIDKLDRPFEVADNIRAYRALTLLERIATPEARQMLEELSRGAPSAWLTVEARQSLQRARRE